jgi:hypothetical protein
MKMTLDEFIGKYGLQMTVASIDSNPNFSADDKWLATAHHYRCIIKRGKKRMTVPFSQGSAVTNPPTLPDVLDCLAMDSGAQLSSFEDWCGDFGYDLDSRKAEKLFRVCRRQAQSLLRLLGSQAALEDLIYQTDRL